MTDQSPPAPWHAAHARFDGEPPFGRARRSMDATGNAGLPPLPETQAAGPAMFSEVLGLSVDRKTFDSVKSRYDAGDPKQRARLIAAGGIVGKIARRIDDAYLKTDAQGNPGIRSMGGRVEDRILYHRMMGMGANEAEQKALKDIAFGIPSVNLAMDGVEPAPRDAITAEDRVRAVLSGFANIPTTLGKGVEMLGQGGIAPVRAIGGNLEAFGQLTGLRSIESIGQGVRMLGSQGFEPSEMLGTMMGVEPIGIKKKGLASVETIGKSIKEVGENAEHYWQQGMTPEGRNPGTFWGKVSQGGLQSVPGTLAMAIPAMGASALLKSLGSAEKLAEALQAAAWAGRSPRRPARPPSPRYRHRLSRACFRPYRTPRRPSRKRARYLMRR